MSKKTGKTNVSRRDFLVRTAAGTGAAALVGFGASEARAMGAIPAQWDQEADVVIVGFGGAGACAAIEAHDAGAKVLLLEKQPKATHYSNTRMAGGIFHCPDPTGDKAALKEYAKAMFSGENLPWKLEGEQPEYSDALAEAWAQYSPENIDFLKRMDPDYKTVAMSGFSGAAFPNFPGAKDSKYRVFGSTYTGRSSLDVPTKHLPKNQKMNGEAFFAALLNGVESRKIQVAYETPAKRLVMNDAGEALGVVAEEKGKPVAIRAKRAVIITSGGYEYNKAMRQAFLEGPGVEGWAFYGTTDQHRRRNRDGPEGRGGLDEGWQSRLADHLRRADPTSRTEDGLDHRLCGPTELYCGRQLRQPLRGGDPDHHGPESLLLL